MLARLSGTLLVHTQTGSHTNWCSHMMLNRSETTFTHEPGTAATLAGRLGVPGGGTSCQNRVDRLTPANWRETSPLWCRRSLNW